MKPFFCLILFFHSPLFVLAQSGTVDVSFNGTGKVELPNAHDVIVEPDGRILVKGDKITKLDQDGNIITQYDELSVFPDPKTENHTQNDGKTITIGNISVPNPYYPEDEGLAVNYAENISGILVERFNVNGSPDLDFGDGGKVVIISNHWDYWEMSTDLIGKDGIVLDDGRIVVVGEMHPFNDSDMATSIVVYKLNEDGSIEDEWASDLFEYLPRIYKLNNNRFVILSSGTLYSYIIVHAPGFDYKGEIGYASGVVEQSDGKIMIGVNVAEDPHTLAWKFNADGDFDETFGNAGNLVDINQDFGFTKSLALQHDNQLLIAGSGSIKRYNNFIETELEIKDKTDTYGTMALEIDISTNSQGAITFTNLTDEVVSINNETGEIIVTGVGKTTIEATQEQWGGYLPTTHLVDISIKKANLTATAQNKTKIYGEENPELTIAYSGFVLNDNESDIEAPVVSTTASVNSDAGTYPIYVEGGNAKNYDITLKNGTLTIQKATQSLEVATVQDKQFGDDESFEIYAEASSGLPVGFEVLSGPATVSENNISLTGPGLVTIKSFQEGNNNYNEVSKNITFCSIPPKPVIEYHVEDAEIVSSSESGNQWLRNGVELPGATDQKLKINLPGIYTVKVSFDGCANVSEATEVNDLVTGVAGETAGDFNFSLYPNPTSYILNITLSGPFSAGTIVTIYDLQGVKMISKELTLTSGNLHAAFELNELSCGMYLVKVAGGEQVMIRRFIKE